MRVPLRVCINLAAVANDRCEYSLTIEVPSKSTGAFRASVVLEGDSERTLSEIESGDLGRLSSPCRMEVAMLLFRFCYSEMCEADGLAIERTFADVTPLLRQGMNETDSQTVRGVLVVVAPRGPESRSISVVRVD